MAMSLTFCSNSKRLKRVRLYLCENMLNQLLRLKSALTLLHFDFKSLRSKKLTRFILGVNIGGSINFFSNEFLLAFITDFNVDHFYSERKSNRNIDISFADV